MRSNLFKACTAGLLITGVPAFALAQTAAPAPIASAAAAQVTATAQPAQVWVTDGSTKHELALTQVQVARTEQSGGDRGANSMVTNLGATVLSVAAGPIGAVASSIFSLFGHHPAPKPSFRAVLALAGQHSAAPLSTNSPSFELDYSNTPGLNPDAYAPAILKLQVTKDNWRLVSLSSASDPSALTALMMPAGMPAMAASGSQAAPSLTEDRVTAASIVMLGRGHAQITLSQPLQPGEYGIVLRPVQNAQNDALQPVLRNVWDFSVRDQSPQQ
jgi:hypothetical protein